MRVLVVGVLVATLMFLGCGPSAPEESKALASSSSAKKAPKKKRVKKPVLEPKKGPEELVKNEKKPLPVEGFVKPPEEEEELEEDDSSAKVAVDEEGKFGDREKKTKIPKHDGKLDKKIDVKKVRLHHLLPEPGPFAELGPFGDGGGNPLDITLKDGFGTGLGGGYGTGTGGGGDGGAGRIDTGDGKAAPAKPRFKRRVAKMSLKGMGATGSCKKGGISSKVKRRAVSLRACYERVLMRKPGLSGKVMAKWIIGLDGRVVGRVKTSGSMSDGSVKSCVARVLQRIRFAKPEGGICVVRWPFVFSSGG